MPQVEVTFDIDANGILNVSAKDKATGREQKITITAGSGLSKDEVEKLQREAELHAAEDKQRREEIETRNAADSLAYSAEKTLRDNADKVPADLKTEVEGKIAAVRTALAGHGHRRGADAPRTSSTRRCRRSARRSTARRAAARRRRPRTAEGGEAPEGTVEGEFREV